MTDDTTETDRRSTDEDRSSDADPGGHGPETTMQNGSTTPRGALRAAGVFATAGVAGVGRATGDVEGELEDVDEYDALPFTVPEGESCAFCEDGTLERTDGEDADLRCSACDQVHPASWWAWYHYREEFCIDVGDIPVRVPEATLRAVRDENRTDPDRFYEGLLNNTTHNFKWYGPDGERLPEFEGYYDGAY